MTLRTMFGDTADPVKVEEAIANGGAGLPHFLATMATQIGANRTTDQAALTNAFKVFDKNDNGKISASELVHVMVNMEPELDEKQLDRLLLDANVDDNGEITYGGLVATLCSSNM